MVVRKDSYGEVLNGLLDDECDIALIGKQPFEGFKRNFTKCTIMPTGKSPGYIPASFVSKVDTGTLCTSLMASVLDLHMNEMDNDGFIQYLWNEHYDQIGNAKSDCNDSGAADENPDPLSMNDIFGIFAVHGICSAFSLFLAFFFRFYGRYSPTSAANDLRSSKNSIWTLRHSPSPHPNEVRIPSTLRQRSYSLLPRITESNPKPSALRQRSYSLMPRITESNPTDTVFSTVQH